MAEPFHKHIGCEPKTFKKPAELKLNIQTREFTCDTFAVLSTIWYHSDANINASLKSS